MKLALPELDFWFSDESDVTAQRLAGEAPGGSIRLGRPRKYYMPGFEAHLVNHVGISGCKKPQLFIAAVGMILLHFKGPPPDKLSLMEAFENLGASATQPYGKKAWNTYATYIAKAKGVSLPTIGVPNHRQILRLRDDKVIETAYYLGWLNYVGPRLYANAWVAMDQMPIRRFNPKLMHDFTQMPIGVDQRFLIAAVSKTEIALMPYDDLHPVHADADRRWSLYCTNNMQNWLKIKDSFTPTEIASVEKNIPSVMSSMLKKMGSQPMLHSAEVYLSKMRVTDAAQLTRVFGSNEAAWQEIIDDHLRFYPTNDSIWSQVNWRNRWTDFELYALITYDDTKGSPPVFYPEGDENEAQRVPKFAPTTAQSGTYTSSISIEYECDFAAEGRALTAVAPAAVTVAADLDPAEEFSASLVGFDGDVPD